MNNEPTIFNQEKAPKPKYFEAITDALLRDEELRRLPGDQRGAVIVDRFIGSIVRHGEVQGSKTNYGPADILAGMDAVGKGTGDIMEITGTDGLRKSVLELADDKDVARMFGQMSARLSHDAKGDHTLTSSAQIEGYLLAGGAENKIVDATPGVDMQGDSWIGVIAEQTQRMAQDPNLDWITNTQAYDLMKSSGPLLKNSGRDWMMANSSARKAGVDVDLIRRSAEHVQRRNKDGNLMGHAALYLATGGKISTYKQDLDRRSGY